MTREDITYLDLAVTLSAIAIFGSIYAYLVCVRLDKDKPEWKDRYIWCSYGAGIFVVLATLFSLLFPQGYVGWVGVITLIVIAFDFRSTKRAS